VIKIIFESIQIVFEYDINFFQLLEATSEVLKLSFDSNRIRFKYEQNYFFNYPKLSVVESEPNMSAKEMRLTSYRKNQPIKSVSLLYHNELFSFLFPKTATKNVITLN
jgi:hypothetical protein